MSDEQERVTASHLLISWRSDENDLPHRSRMIRQITKMLQERKENPDPKWVQQLPFKARKLEEFLYKNASSLQEYAEEKSLKQRVKKAALSIARQIRIERAYSSGLWSRPSPRNSLLSSSTRTSVSSQASLTSIGPDFFETEKETEPSTSDLWDAAVSSSSTNWDVPSRRSSSISRIEGLSLSVEKLDTEPSLPQAMVPRVSLSELSDLRSSNQKLQKEILENIRRQKDSLRAEYNVIPP